MKNYLLILALFFISGGVASAQCGTGMKLAPNVFGSQPPFICVSANQKGPGPTNPCPTAGINYTDTTNNVFYICPSAGGSWFAVGGVNPLAAIPTSGPISGVTSLSLTATQIGQGVNPIITVYNNANPIHKVQFDEVIGTNPGDRILNFNPAFTGTWVAYGGTGGFSDPLTTDGDINYRNGVGTNRLPKGADNSLLGVDATAHRPAYTNLTNPPNLMYNQGGSGAVARTVDAKLKDTVSVKEFGAIGDGTTNDYAAIIAGNTAAVAAGKCLFFPSATYASATAIAVIPTTNGTCWIGETGTRLKYTGGATTNAVSFDGTSLGNGARVVMQKILIDGNGLATNGLQLLKIVGMDVSDVTVTNVSGKGFLLRWCVGGSMSRPTVSINFEPFTTKPVNGLYFTDQPQGASPDPTTLTSVLDVITPRMEGVSGDGIVIANAQSVNIRGGESEGNLTGAGISCTVGAGHNMIDGIYMEGNLKAVSCGGFSNVFMQLQAAGSHVFEFTGTAYSNMVLYGQIDSITFAAGTTVNQVNQATLATSITDSGTAGTNSWFGNYSQANGPIPNHVLGTTESYTTASGHTTALIAGHNGGFGLGDENRLDFRQLSLSLGRLASYYLSGSGWGIKAYTYNAGLNATASIDLLPNGNVNFPGVVTTGSPSNAVNSMATVDGTQTLTNKSIAGSEINSGLIGSTYGGTGVNNGTNTLALSGNLATTGAFNPTFSIPSSSTWTFPTGGGTLAATFSATTATITPGALLAGACTAYTTTTVTGARSTMAVATSPAADPGASTTWFSYVSANDTVSTKVCAGLASTPAATTYALRVIQ